MLDYPLTGTYEFSCEAYAGPWAESVLTHDGLAILPFWVEGTGSISPVGQSEPLNIPWRLHAAGRLQPPDRPGQPQKVRYLVNGHLFYEDDDPSPTAPGSACSLTASDTRSGAGSTLPGQPTIPREVSLSQGDRLEGWVSASTTRPSPRANRRATTDQWGNVVSVARGSAVMRRFGAASKTGRQEAPPTDQSRRLRLGGQDGVIHGRRAIARLRFHARQRQVRRRRHRRHRGRARASCPISARSATATFSTYEFLYEPGQVMVHPALGRLAFLLEPAGVKVHWMTTGGSDLSGLPADNSARSRATAAGPTRFPLKPGQWNAVKLAMQGDKVTLELNGQTIYERPLEPSLGRQFGLFHLQGPDRRAGQQRRAPRPMARRAVDRATGQPDRPRPEHARFGRRPPRTARPDRRVDLRPRGRRRSSSKARGLPPERAI